MQDPKSQGLLYFYFDFTDESKRSTGSAIRSLIRQLYDTKTATQEVLNLLYQNSLAKGDRPGIQVLASTLQAMLDKCDGVWIVLDGLDECETRGQRATDGVMAWVKNIRSRTNVHLLVTSRPEQDIKSNIESWADAEQIVPLQSDLVADDIGAYIDTKVSQMDRWQNRAAIQELIKTTLKSKAGGM